MQSRPESCWHLPGFSRAQSPAGCRRGGLLGLPQANSHPPPPQEQNWELAPRVSPSGSQWGGLAWDGVSPCREMQVVCRGWCLPQGDGESWCRGPEVEASLARVTWHCPCPQGSWAGAARSYFCLVPRTSVLSLCSSAQPSPTSLSPSLAWRHLPWCFSVPRCFPQQRPTSAWACLPLPPLPPSSVPC